MPKTDKELQNLLTLIPFFNSSRGMHIAKVADRLGVSKAAVFKYFDQLNMYGSDPYDPGSMFMATVDDDGLMDITSAEQFKGPLHLTASEMAALRLALAQFSGFSGYRPTVKRVLEKLEGALLPQDRQAVDKLDQSLIVNSGGQQLENILKTLNQAKTKRLAAEIVYFAGSTGEVKKRVIDPYGFVIYSGQWYAVAFCREAKETRTFKVDRIKEIVLTGRSYTIPEDFDINDYIQDGGLFRPTGQEQEVVIRFSPKIARWILERSSEAKKNPDGSATLTLKANSFAWVARWILVYGPEAEILAPEVAREEVRKILDSGHEN